MKLGRVGSILYILDLLLISITTTIVLITDITLISYSNNIIIITAIILFMAGKTLNTFEIHKDNKNLSRDIGIIIGTLILLIQKILK